MPRGARSPALKSTIDFSTWAGVNVGRTTDGLNDGADPRLLPVYDDVADSAGVTAGAEDIWEYLKK